MKIDSDDLPISLSMSAAYITALPLETYPHYRLAVTLSSILILSIGLSSSP